MAKTVNFLHDKTSFSFEKSQNVLALKHINCVTYIHVRTKKM